MLGKRTDQFGKLTHAPLVLIVTLGCVFSTVADPVIDKFLEDSLFKGVLRATVAGLTAEHCDDVSTTSDSFAFTNPTNPAPSLGGFDDLGGGLSRFFSLAPKLNAPTLPDGSLLSVCIGCDPVNSPRTASFLVDTGFGATPGDQADFSIGYGFDDPLDVTNSQLVLDITEVQGLTNLTATFFNDDEPDPTKKSANYVFEDPLAAFRSTVPLVFDNFDETNVNSVIFSGTLTTSSPAFVTFNGIGLIPTPVPESSSSIWLMVLVGGGFLFWKDRRSELAGRSVEEQPSC